MTFENPQPKKENSYFNQQTNGSLKSMENNRETLYKRKLVWRNIIILAYVHIVAVYSAVYITECKWEVSLFAFGIGTLSAIGVTAGAHRLWTHKSYKAKLPLKILLMVFQTLSFQQSIYDWARDHRVHHKYTDTDADPHNSKRGFFFSHVGWLLVNKHPEVTKKGKNIDMTDLTKDPIVMWQKKNANWFLPIFGFLFPFWLSAVIFDEHWLHAWNAQCFRYVVGLNVTWLLNSAAHMWGAKPYDKHISPTDTLAMGIMCFGEGWHNYHHVFPWDYKTSELSRYGYNFTIAFIDLFAKIGWAYDLKTVSEETIRKRMLRTGDGSKEYSNIKNITLKSMSDFNNNCSEEKIINLDKNIWGWDDQDLDEEDRSLVKILNKENHV